MKQTGSQHHNRRQIFLLEGKGRKWRGRKGREKKKKNEGRERLEGKERRKDEGRVQ